MSWKKPTYSGLVKRVGDINEIWNRLLEIQADDVKEKLERIKAIAENAETIKEYREADKEQFKARIIEE